MVLDELPTRWQQVKLYLQGPFGHQTWEFMRMTHSIHSNIATWIVGLLPDERQQAAVSFQVQAHPEASPQWVTSQPLSKTCYMPAPAPKPLKGILVKRK